MPVLNKIKPQHFGKCLLSDVKQQMLPTIGISGLICLLLGVYWFGEMAAPVCLRLSGFFYPTHILWTPSGSPDRLCEWVNNTHTVTGVPRRDYTRTIWELFPWIWLAWPHVNILFQYGCVVATVTWRQNGFAPCAAFPFPIGSFVSTLWSWILPMMTYVELKITGWERQVNRKFIYRISWVNWIW